MAGPPDAGRQQKILGELMQWGVTSQTSDH
mgnify:CR=1 FL=1